MVGPSQQRALGSPIKAPSKKSLSSAWAKLWVLADCRGTDVSECGTLVVENAPIPGTERNFKKLAFYLGSFYW